MRAILASFAILIACTCAAPAQQLQWQSHRQTGQPVVENSVSRGAVRFKRPTPAAESPAPPETLTHVEASPIVQVAHERAAPRPAFNPRRPSRVAQANGGESLPAPEPDRSNPTPAPGLPYESYEGYSEHHGDVEFEGPAMCGPECGCGCPEPGCEFIEASCGFGDCCCGEVGCAGDCCGDACGCGDACHTPCFGGCKERGAIPVCFYLPPIKDFTVFGGVHGFKGALDQYRDRGNFGFHGGFNAGGKMAWLPWPGLGFQFGYQGTVSQLHGSSVNPLYDDAHAQNFITAGLFKRSCVGFSYGVVYDMLNDERIESTSFSQVRGLVSMTNCHGHEVGFQFAVSDNTKQIAGDAGAGPVTRSYEPIDQYLGFWRYTSCRGGDIAFKAGGGSGFGILSADLNVPLDTRWSLNGGFTYFIPDGSGQLAAQEEGWNLGMNLVWHWGCKAKSRFKNPYRPLFDVADNGSFYVDDLD